MTKVGKDGIKPENPALLPSEEQYWRVTVADDFLF